MPPTTGGRTIGRTVRTSSTRRRGRIGSAVMGENGRSHGQPRGEVGMRRGMWAAAAAALVVVLSGAGGLGGGGRVLAADGRVTIGGDTESDINKWGFTPKELTVPAGTTVAWHNGGQQAHTVTADDGKSFSSPSVAPGADFQFAFQSARAYR